MGEILEFRNVGKSFSGNHVLKDVSFKLKEGEILGLVGENGAGKSTMMNILFGMSFIKETGGYEGDVPVSYTHLTLPTTLHECRSRWSPYH